MIAVRLTDCVSAAAAHDCTSRCRLQTLVRQQSRCYLTGVTFTIELEREDDGRWLAEVPALSGVMCYGTDRDEAIARVQALALRVIADRLEHREVPAEFLNVSFNAA
jgi:predicted RNase H-like HicB family nuclease